jgi:hypothetical protein
VREKLEKPGDGESKARHLLCAGWQLPDAVYRCAGGRLVQAPEDRHVRGAKPSGVTAGLGARRPALPMHGPATRSPHIEKTTKFRLIPSTHSTCAAMSIFPSGPTGRAVTAERDRYAFHRMPT